jgi:AAA ATPase domain
LTSELPARRPLVGRRQALSDLHAALGQAVAGDGCLFLVGGEPGIGKTRLAQHLSADVAGTGVRALWGTCWDGEGAPPFWPWLQVLRGYGAARDPAGLRAELGPEAGEIARLVPELTGGTTAEPAANASAESRFRLFDSVAAFLRRASGGQPLLVVLDDLHWADEPSLQLLRFLAGDLRGSRLLLVGTYRDLEVGPGHPLSRLTGGLTGAVHQLQLEGLTPAEVGELVSLLTGSPLADDRAAAVHRLTNGNPFFVRELVRLPATAPSADSRMPEGVRQVVRRRLAAQSPPCRDLLAAAAVLGPEFDPALVSATVGMPPPRVAVLLDQAKAARLVETAAGGGPYRFVHALVREVLYSDLPAARRRRLHHQAGTALEQRHRRHLEGREAELAVHFRQAGGRLDLARALDLSEAAADRSLRLLAHEDAATHLQRALELLELVDDADDDRRCRLLLALARARMAAGEIAAAREASSRAAAVAREIGAPDLLAQAALGFQAEFTAESVDDAEVHLLEEALQGLHGQRPELRARLLARLARALLFGPQMERRRALADEAEALARRLGDPATLSAVLYERHQAVWGLPSDEPRGRLRLAQEAIGLAEGIGDHTSALHCRALLLGDLLELGEMERLRTEMADYAAAVERLRQRQLAWQPLMQRATLAMLEARFDEAEALAGEGLALGRRVQHVGIDNFYSAIWSINRMLQGRHGETLETMRRAVRAFPAFPVYRAPLALALIESGRPEEGRAEFERLAAGEFHDLPRDFVWVMFLALLSMVCVRLGDRPRARLLYDLLLPSAETNVRVTRIGIGCAGSAHHYLGLLCATLGRWDEAVRRFDAAGALHRRMASPVLLVTSQHELGRALLARDGAGDAERGRAELAAARRLAAAIGVRLGADEPAPPEASRVELRREGDSWAVVRAGRSFRLRDSVGLRHLARLLAEPGRERHALDLAGPGGSIPRDTGAGSGLLDDRARSEYRERLRELAGEIEEAESWGDPERAASARREVDLLTEQLAAAVGLGGRDRGGASSAERARVTVTKAIRAAQHRIAREDADLGAHLAVSLRTGTFCVYRPDPGSPITWTVRP